MIDYFKVWMDSFDYKGKTTRKVAIKFYLFNILILSLLKNVILVDSRISVIRIAVITILPATALIVRRLHDLNMSGAYIFFFLVPFGQFYLFYLVLFRKGTEITE